MKRIKLFLTARRMQRALDEVRRNPSLTNLAALARANRAYIDARYGVAL